MQIDPRISFSINFLLMLVSGIATGAVHFTGLVPDPTAAAIVGWAGVATFVIATLNTALHGYSAATSGPLSPLPVPPASNVIKMVLAFLTVSLFLIGPKATHAEPLVVHHHRLVVHRLSKAAAASSNPLDPLGLWSKVKTDLESISSFLSTWTSDDINGAVTLSTQIPGLQDQVGQQCWKSFSSIGALVKAHPLPATLKVATDFESARLFEMAIGQVCQNQYCTQMWSDLSNQIGALGGVPISSFSSLCSKIHIISGSITATTASAIPSAH
jgi:hypothetical protein